MNPHNDATSAQAEVLLVHYWYVLRKRKFVVLGFMGLLLGTVIIGTLTATPYYRSTAVIEILPDAPAVFDVDEVTDVVSNRGGLDLRLYYATQYRIIQSRKVLEKSLGVLRSEHGITEFDDALEPITAFRENMHLAPDSETYIVKIAFEYPDPEKAALFANVTAEVYQQNNLDRSLDASLQALDWLEERQKEYRLAKVASDEKVHSFKFEKDLAGIDEKYNSTMRVMGRLQDAWGDAHAGRIESQVVFEELERLEQSNDWLSLANYLAAESPIVQVMLGNYQALKQERAAASARYLPAHPKLVELATEMSGLESQIRAQIGEIVGGRRAGFLMSKRKEQALRSELSLLEKQVESLDRDRIELDLLQSEADRNEEFYKNLDTRHSEVNLSTVRKANNVRFIDRAIPEIRQVRPVMSVNVGMALVLGLFGGAALAFLMEYLDGTVKSREDVEEVIGVPFLGVVPMLEPTEHASMMANEDRSIFVHASPRSTVAECLRTVRTNVLFKIPKEKLQYLLVTSAAPREGKSFVSSNLAAIIAMMGSRVLLIDADLRRPSQHRLFGAPNGVGLSSVLTGAARFEDAVYRTHVKGLDLLAAGPIPDNPAELLGGPMLKKLLAHVASYDLVLIDSPPVTVVADPLVLCPMADGVVLVIEANGTRRGLVQQARTRLTEMNANILGAVVNKLNVRTSGYGYYLYYDRYSYYYGTPENEPDRQRLG
jgi:capsular exopolysaccharide synthesis family protein